ncbi:MAG: LPXTG cell wall anchor domain-containing protein [Mesorhizobium sp.]|nr:MAG: LPXTG cell wall anchor domain-containing protein [Mesorhizobium sp.]TIT47998.1 MAG: LPXTG cell wall anchor domain-containing protein [Mesorhizobium sp.]
MTGQSQWLYVGIVAMLVGLVGLVWANRSRS